MSTGAGKDSDHRGGTKGMTFHLCGHGTYVCMRTCTYVHTYVQCLRTCTTLDTQQCVYNIRVLADGIQIQTQRGRQFVPLCTRAHLTGPKSVIEGEHRQHSVRISKHWSHI